MSENHVTMSPLITCITTRVATFVIKFKKFWGLHSPSHDHQGVDFGHTKPGRRPLNQGSPPLLQSTRRHHPQQAHLQGHWRRRSRSKSRDSY
jgi:hypothetical protein